MQSNFFCKCSVWLGLRSATWIVLIIAAGLLILSSAPADADEAASEHFAFPMNVSTDSSGFKFYLNEEVLVESRCLWNEDGSFLSESTLSASGQSVSTSFQIDVDDNNDWTAMSMKTATFILRCIRRTLWNRNRIYERQTDHIP